MELSLKTALAFSLAVGLGQAASASMLLIDFGDTTAVTVADGSNTWNTVIGPVTSDLKDTDNNPTTIDVAFSTGFAKNNPGGLAAPSAALLGDFAVASATADYFFTTSSSSFNLEELDPSKTYNLSFFGTRDTSSVRETRYTVAGLGGPSSQVLQTSGAGAGSGGGTGNDDTILTFTGIVPDASNSITVTYAVESGGFGYLGVLGVEVVPEPGTQALLGLGGLTLLRRRTA